MTVLKISGTLKDDPRIHADGTGIVASAVLLYTGSEMRLVAIDGCAQYLSGLHAGDGLQVSGVIKNSGAGIEMIVASVSPPSNPAPFSIIKPLAIPRKLSKKSKQHF